METSEHRRRSSADRREKMRERTDRGRPPSADPGPPDAWNDTEGLMPPIGDADALRGSGSNSSSEPSRDDPGDACPRLSSLRVPTIGDEGGVISGSIEDSSSCC